MTTPGITQEQLIGSADQTLSQVEQAIDHVNAGLALVLGANAINPLENGIDREKLESLGGHMIAIAEKVRSGILTFGAVLELDLSQIEPDTAGQDDTTPDQSLPTGSNGALPAGSTTTETTTTPQATENGSTAHRRRRTHLDVTDADRDGSYHNTLHASTEIPADGIPEDVTPLRIDPKTSTLRINGESLILDKTHEHTLMNALLSKGDQFFARGDLKEIYGDKGAPGNFGTQLRRLEKIFRDEFGIDLTENNGSTGAGLKYRLNPQLFPIDHNTYEDHFAPKA